MKKIKSKKFNVVNKGVMVVAIDASKDKHTGYFRFPDGTDMKPFDFRNDGRGFNEFWGHVNKAMKTHKLEEVVVGFESTGPYVEPFVHYVKKRGARVVQVNPMHTKRLKELVGNSPSKTDYKDPKIIADIMALGHALTVVVPEGVAAELRRLTQARERTMQRRIALLNQLHSLVFLIFPEFLQVMKDIKTKTAQHLLKYCPTPLDIERCGIEGLTGILKKVSCGKLGRGRAEALFDAAINSSGIKEGVYSIVLEVREIVTSIEACDRFIAEIEREMTGNLSHIPYSRYIMSIKGIKAITAACVIGEVGDFSKFNTIAEIEKLAGLDLYEISSGQRRGNRRISKRGRYLLRKLLYFASLNVVRKGGILHEWYQKAIGRGMHKMKAIIGVSRKLLRIIFALVRRHSNFIAGYQQHGMGSVGNVSDERGMLAA